MGDQIADEEEDKTDNSSPAKINHTKSKELSPDNAADELPGEKSGCWNQNIDDNWKIISTGDQVEQAAIKCWN